MTKKRLSIRIKAIISDPVLLPACVQTWNAVRWACCQYSTKPYHRYPQGSSHFYFTRFASKAHTCLSGCILGVNVLHSSAMGHRQRAKVYFYHSLFHSSLVGWMGAQNCSDKPFLLRSESTKWKSDLWKGWLKYIFDCFLERTQLVLSFPLFERGHLSTYASCEVRMCFLLRQLSRWWHAGILKTLNLECVLCEDVILEWNFDYIASMQLLV